MDYFSYIYFLNIQYIHTSLRAPTVRRPESRREWGITDDHWHRPCPEAAGKTYITSLVLPNLAGRTSMPVTAAEWLCDLVGANLITYVVALSGICRCQHQRMESLSSNTWGEIIQQEDIIKIWESEILFDIYVYNSED